MSDCVADRKQTLERSSRNVEVFQSSEPQLRQWLSEKELMMKVLGPVSVDPNMLNHTKHQSPCHGGDGTRGGQWGQQPSGS